MAGFLETIFHFFGPENAKIIRRFSALFRHIWGISLSVECTKNDTLQFNGHKTEMKDTPSKLQAANVYFSPNTLKYYKLPLVFTILRKMFNLQTWQI